MTYRIESDCLGDMKISNELYYGIQTSRAINNFPVSGQTMREYISFIESFVQIKKAAAMTNYDIGILDAAVAKAICDAADEILNGRFRDQFPIDIFQGGGFTSTNMNVNEVIANRANELLTGTKGYTAVHPNDHVNMAQSTNDVTPAAMLLTCYKHANELLDAIQHLEEELQLKVQQYSNVVKVSRTCLQDAVPITLGQQFSGYASVVSRHISLLEKIKPIFTMVPLGATAAGTGLGIHPGYKEKIAQHLSIVMGFEVSITENMFDALQNSDHYVQLSGLLKSFALCLGKVAADFRLMSSGPRAGFNEITLPAVQPGSSIMPGKINPVMPEMINQICYQVCGNDYVITLAVERGELDLNVWEPSIVKSLTESFKILTNGTKIFVDKCIKGLVPNIEVCQKHAENSLAIATVISAIFDYNTGVKVAKEAFVTGNSVKDVVVRNGLLSEKEASMLLDPLMLTDPDKSSKLLSQARKGQIMESNRLMDVHQNDKS